MLIVGVKVQPSNLDAFLCSLGSQSNCDAWNIANFAHAAGLVIGICGLIIGAVLWSIALYNSP